MHAQLVLSAEPICPPPCPSEIDSQSNGAVVIFWGIVRAKEMEQDIAGLEYSAHEPMARHQFEILFNAAGEKWPVQSVRLIHRLGFVAVGEPSLWIETRSPHRAAAFAACQWIVDEMKRVVPIWKKVVSK